jgi:uncharacterized protein
MFAIISPAKRIRPQKTKATGQYTIPEFLDRSEELIGQLKKLNTTSLQTLMDINNKLAEENIERILSWDIHFNPEIAQQALLAFSGDVYLGIDAPSFTEQEFEFAQNHLGILSGLHGLLRPLDLIRPYRLEMGLKMKVGKYNNLYEFWGGLIPKLLLKRIKDSGTNVLVNLASNEYFKSVNPGLLKDVHIITPDFREYKNGGYQFVHVLGKKARGYMVRFIAKNKIVDPEQLKLFDTEGYAYNDRLSGNGHWVFTRG